MDDKEKKQQPQRINPPTSSSESSSDSESGSEESGPIIPIRPAISIPKRKPQSTFGDSETESEPEPEPKLSDHNFIIKPIKKLKKKPRSKEIPKPKSKPKPKIPIQTEQAKIEEKKFKELEKQREQRKIKQETELDKDPAEFLREYLESSAATYSKITLEELAKPPSRIIRELENKEKLFYPKEKVDRIKDIVKQETALTAEQLEEYLRKEKQKSELIEKNKKLREKIYIKTLKKLENQCKSQIMDEITDKFINYISQKSVNYEISNMTETMQKLSMAIKKYIFLILSPKTCFWECDESALDKLSTILAELMLNALYLTRKYEKDPSCEEQMDMLFMNNSYDDDQERCNDMNKFTDDMYKCLQERSWIAANRNIKRITIKNKKN